MSHPPEDLSWRDAALRAGHVSLAFAGADTKVRQSVFGRQQAALPASANRVVLSAWRKDWAREIPEGLHPPWVAALNGAPVTACGFEEVKQLNQEWLDAYPDLAVIKPCIRWTSLDKQGVSRRSSASPGEVLLEFSDPSALARTLDSCSGGLRLAPYVLSKGASAYYSPTTWRMLRQLSESEDRGPLLLGINLGSLSLHCFGSRSTMKSLVERLGGLT